jgi:hypothetical protein
VAHANWRLDNPPVVDVAVSRRMGLFVVARLAARHGIRVRLRPAPVGGLTALVWLPDEVITLETFAPTLATRRFQPAPAGGTARWMDQGLTDGEPDERAAAARAVSAAHAPRFEPSRPGNGDAAAEAGAGLGANAILAAPANGLGSGSPGGALAAHELMVPPAVGNGQENRLPIFESVESDWFRRGRPAVDRPVPVRGSDDWSSPADAGWRAAEVAQAPVSTGTTGAGLPKRVPKANLVPGGVGASSALPPVPARSAAQTRDRLASFQQGIRRARAATSEDESHTSGAADGPP